MDGYKYFLLLEQGRLKTKHLSITQQNLSWSSVKTFYQLPIIFLMHLYFSWMLSCSDCQHRDVAVMGISIPHLTLQLQGWSCSLLTKTKLFSCSPFVLMESKFTMKARIFISKPFFFPKKSRSFYPEVSHMMTAGLQHPCMLCYTKYCLFIFSIDTEVCML